MDKKIGYMITAFVACLTLVVFFVLLFLAQGFTGYSSCFNNCVYTDACRNSGIMAGLMVLFVCGVIWYLVEKYIL